MSTTVHTLNVAAPVRRRQLRANLPTFDMHNLKSVLDAMPAVAWMTDRQLRVVHAFGDGLRIVGADGDRMIGQPLGEAFGCGQIDEIVRGTAAALRGEYRQFECVWADRVYDAQVRPVFDEAGQITGACGVALDVTERNESTDRLRRLAGVVNSSDAAIIALGSDGCVKTWNRGAERLFGCTQPDAIGQPLADLFEETDEIQAIMSRVLSGERVAARVLALTPHHDRRPRYVSSTVSPIKNGAGRVVGVAIVTIG